MASDMWLSRAQARTILQVLDTSEYPLLIHCKAGLHRTGVMTAVYRMEYEGWSPALAIQELKANGFGEFACDTSNDYLVQYIQAYRPRQKRSQESGVRGQKSGVR